MTNDLQIKLEDQKVREDKLTMKILKKAKSLSPSAAKLFQNLQYCITHLSHNKYCAVEIHKYSNYLPDKGRKRIAGTDCIFWDEIDVFTNLIADLKAIKLLFFGLGYEEIDYYVNKDWVYFQFPSFFLERIKKHPFTIIKEEQYGK